MNIGSSLWTWAFGRLPHHSDNILLSPSEISAANSTFSSIISDTQTKPAKLFASALCDSQNQEEWLYVVSVLVYGTWIDRAELFRKSKVSNDASDLVAQLCVECSLIDSKYYAASKAFADFIISHSRSVRKRDDIFAEEDSDTGIERCYLKDIDEWGIDAINSIFSQIWQAGFAHALLAKSMDFQVPSVDAGETATSYLLCQMHLFLLSRFVSDEASVARNSVISDYDREKGPVWPLIYSSEVHGKSWGALMARIEGVGSIVIVVRDLDGHIFGGYCPVALEPASQFRDAPNAFLFEFCDLDGRGRNGIYTNQSVNRNHIYFNSGMSTLPNGIGFGGQMSYFGLWLDSSLEYGNSDASPRSTTFGSPQLTRERRFLVDEVQVYLVRAAEVDERLVARRAKGSVLHGHATESALLEMAGRARNS